MNKRVLSCSYLGAQSFLIEVEIDISTGLPIFSIIGLGDTAISESKDRIKTALKNSNFPLIPKKIIVNLSPAGLKKEGAHFDLPISIGIMVAMGFIKDKFNILDNYLFIGELSLSGKIKSVKGAINTVILAKELGYKGVVLPADNYYEANLIKNIDIISVSSLKDASDFITNNIKKKLKLKPICIDNQIDIDFSDVKGQTMAKRGLEIAAAGKHNLIMIDSPGSGKTMLCKRFQTILPPLTDNEIIKATKIHSIAGKLSKTNPIITSPPFRSPHHTSSPVSIIGGGKKITPGEVSLASTGVLFLDEIAEFPRAVLESLRQPIEDKKVSITRALYKVEFDSDFILIAASNPCPCGYYFEGDRCNCTQTEVNKYMKKFSGPIMDRIDLHIEIRQLSETELTTLNKCKSSKEIRSNVIKARNIQYSRLGIGRCNSDMNQSEISKYCVLSKEDRLYFKKVIKILNISARSYDKILTVARTIADLDNSHEIHKKHLMEALSFRKK